MTLTNRDLIELTAWRRKLHRQPEISNEEEKTAKEVVSFLADTGPDKVLTGLGGHGVAAVYDSGQTGPTVLFRSELDALPIEELSGAEHSSQVPGKSHMCGHDGHTAILAALGRQLGRQRPARGRIVLMFQPAEETGNGAAGVVADPRFSEIAPDFAFSLHNLPGVPFGEVRLKAGTVNCASRGMRIVLEGKTAHSSMPETGVSPMLAVSELMPQLPALGRGTFADDDFGMVTVTHAEMGEAVFGIAPGHAEVWATLRTRRDERMAELVAAAEALATRIAAGHRLAVRFDYHEIFVASVNAPDAVEHLARALDEEGVPHGQEALPMRASEDFGIFGHNAKSAMFFLGAGERHPALHNPDYDFPDDLIPIGSRIFMRTARNLLG
ncbi:amidohydrolase [Mesorhizobium sp. M1C.F.Ca.ET.193.01.1.1]|uniref:amidohydrolase n=2 Tax=Mesorhizobium TaxID=68287 RepID=UPI000FD32155|nr:MULTISPECIES: amidohydrolase [unclassified Mesorhizobium]TGS93363.1 amidohydrolase [bacterium M00.F.Ca.ET.177.01.1.1]TGQ50640.1 amidohydrolase [Mesorhizobium sp. M1C.F.Ca.ET.210.01.1.1]TGQ65811.1 amidohydrolase [Mesorhizobium sp. M1C.F.Ca.ET.212.01.1.1]TGQ99756.1 amidohydrolase [Mesorhizobium sp. M1C.F.Ca.ET.204.01.1.1]TGR20172.1 amidohydrolase [Mesorhizobium sp. M1C.F.Ca.ET.196.01.1.1]